MEPRPAAEGNQRALLRPEPSVPAATARDAASDPGQQRQGEKAGVIRPTVPPAAVLKASGPEPMTATGEMTLPAPARTIASAVPPAQPRQSPTRRVTIGQVEVQVINQPSVSAPLPAAAPANRLGEAPNVEIDLERFRFRL